MLQQGIQMDEEKFCCSICLDLLKDPVTIPCGHSYCMSCIKSHWNEEDQKETYSCPQCRQTFISRPVLVKNTMLADLAEELKRTGLQAAPADHCYAGPEDVACDFCTGRKLKAFKSCLQCLVSYCEQHLQPHYESSAFEKHKLVDPSKKLQENICSHHNEVMKLFCYTDQQCICLICSMDEHKEHDTVSVTAEMAERQKELETTRQKIQQGIQNREKDVKRLQQEVEVINHSADKAVEDSEPQPEPKTRADFLKYSRLITLDPNTANMRLLLSEGNRKVTAVRDKQLTVNSKQYPHHPDRFTQRPQVLSKDSLTGRCYWEVERHAGATVAVSYKDIRRKGRSSVFGNNDRSWALESYEFKHKRIRTSISGPRSTRLGVYLDHSAGLLSFYSISDTMTLLHRVQTTFTQPLYAGFSVYGWDNCVKLCELK